MDYKEFSSRIKSKYPQYQDMDDMELARKIVDKYPQQYSDVTFDIQEQPKKQPVQRDVAPKTTQQPTQQPVKLQGQVKQTRILPQYADVVNNPNLTKEQKAQQIQAIGEAERAEFDKQLKKYKTRQWLGAGLQIAAGALPVGIGGRVGAAAVKALAPKIGQMAARGLVGGTVGGLAGGAVSGIGTGIMNDENILKSSAREALIGAGLGAGLGAAGGKVAEKVIKRIKPKSAKNVTEAIPEQEIAPKISDVPQEKIIETPVEPVAETTQQIVEEAPQTQQQTFDIIGAKLPDENVQLKTDEIKQSQLAQKADLPPEMRAAINENPPEYQVLHNDELMRQAQDNIAKDFSSSKARLQSLASSDRKTAMTDLDFEEARQVISRLYQEGNIDEANELIRQVSQKATEAGRSVQALSLWSRTTPEGAVRQAQKIINEYNEQNVPKNIQNAVKDISKDIKNISNEEAEAKFNDWLSRQGQTKEVQKYNQNGDKIALLKGMERLRQRNIKKLERQEQNVISLKQKQELMAQKALEKEEQQAIKALEREEKANQKRIEQIVNKNVKNSSVRKTIIDNLNELNKRGGLTPENIQKLINKKYGIEDLTAQQANDIIALTENIQKATTDDEREVATALLLKYQSELLPAKAADKVKTLRNISLLLNLKTFGRNLVGNALLSGIEQPTKALAAGIDKLMSLKTGERTRALPQVKEYLQGLVQGTKKGARDVKLGINTRDNIGKRYDLPQRRSFEAPVISDLEKLLGYSLQVPDRAFYEATFNESLANQMRAKGVQEATGEMVQNATNDALEAVFQNDTALSDLTLKGRRALNTINIGGFGLGDLKIPYAQTPANVVQMGINYSPLGLAKGAYTALQGNQRQASLDLARGLVGSGLFGLGAYGVGAMTGDDGQGLITEPIEDYQIRKNYETLGIRPNQINIGDTGYSYSQLQPLALPLTAGAATGSQEDANMSNIANAALSQLADLPMLRGISEITDDVRYGGWGDALVNLPAGLPSQFVPTLLNQINAYSDPYQRETYDPNTLKRGINQALSKIPVASRALPYKYDVRGEKVKKYESEGVGKAYDVFLNPVFANKKKDDPVMQELLGIYERTGNKSQLLEVAKRNVSYKDEKGEKVDKKLTGKELSEYQRQLGQVTYKTMQQIMNTPFYNNLDDQNKIKLLNNIKKNSKQVVDENFLGKPQSKRIRMLRKLYKTDRQKALDELMSEVRKITPILSEKYYNETIGE